MQILIPLCFSRSMLVRTGLLFLALAGFAACGNINSSARAQDVGAYLTMESPHADNTSPFAQPVLSLPQQSSRRFTPEMPARIMVIGDSLSQGFADAMIQRSTERGMPVVVQNRGRVSTGLARSDFHDWPADFATLAASEQPDIVVAHFGANDMQGVMRRENRASYDSDDWPKAYRTEIRRILSTAAQQRIVVVWLGPAPDGNTGLGRHMTVINPLFEAEARDAGAIFLPLGRLTGGTDGGFVRAITLDGREVTIRTSDGSHFNMMGYKLVADHILDALQARFPDLQPGGDELAVLQ